MPYERRFRGNCDGTQGPQYCEWFPFDEFRELVAVLGVMSDNQAHGSKQVG